MPFLCAMKDGRRRGREGGKEQGEGRTFPDVLTGQSPLCVGGGAFEVSYRQREGCGSQDRYISGPACFFPFIKSFFSPTALPSLSTV